MGAGYVGLAVGWVGLGFVGVGGGGVRRQIALLCVLLVGCGIGCDCVNTPAFTEAKRSADDIAVVVEEDVEGGEAGGGYEGGGAVVYQDGETLPSKPDKKEEGVNRGAKAYGAAFAMMNMAFAAGSMCGPLVGGAVMQGVGWRDLTMGTGVVCAVCAGVRWGVGRRKGRKRSGVEDGGGRG